MRLKRPTRQRNSTVYTGLVGKPMRLPKYRPRICRVVLKITVRCINGPWVGRSLCLTAGGDMRTLPVVIRGEAGHYDNGKWVPFARVSTMEINHANPADRPSLV